MKRSPADLAAGLALFAIAAAGLGGGLLGNRVPADLNAASLMDLFGVPFAVAASAISLILALRSGAPHTLKNAGLLSGTLLSLLALTSMGVNQGWANTVPTTAILVSAAMLSATVGILARQSARAGSISLAVAATAGVAAAVGVWEFAVQYSAGHGFWRVFATFTNPNFFAGFLLCTLPLTAGLLLALPQGIPARIAALSAMLQLTALLLTQGRSALIALLIAAAAFAIAVRRCRPLPPIAVQRVRRLAILASVLAALAAGPVVMRFGRSSGESHSAAFRRLTWQGSLRAAQAAPLLGHGPGRFDAAYPRFALVGYTQHAHSSFLQTAVELGFPALLCTLLLLASAKWRAWQGCRPSSAPQPTTETQAPPPAKTTKKRPPAPTSLPQPPTALHTGLLQAGLFAAIPAVFIHNLTDSDLWTPAVLTMLAAVLGLTAGLSRPQQTPAHDTPPPPPNPLLVLPAAVVAALLVVVSLGTMGGRAQASRAASLTPSDPIAAIEGYKAALTFEPWNTEYRLTLAGLYEAAIQQPSAENEFKNLLASQPSAKAHYRYGRFLLRMQRPAEAAAQFAKTRTMEPGNLQNLLALAEAQQTAGNPQAALQVYRDMVTLHKSVFGQIRAIPELPDWEFGLAYAAVGTAEAQALRQTQAEPLLREGCAILSEYWRTRSLRDMQMPLREDTKQMIRAKYEAALTQWAEVLHKLGRTAEAQAARNRRDTQLADP
jgi:O-antigen ligase/tetratricopeptide (TPR) repeat protein